MKTNARHYTNLVSDMLDEGLISSESFISAVLSYMSEDEVKDLAESNEWLEEEEEEEEEEEDEEEDEDEEDEEEE